MKYITKVLLGVDQFANTIIGGSPDETISARSGRLRCGKRVVDRFWWRPLAAGLDLLQKGHVESAICHEEDGSQQDPAYKEVYDLEDRCVTVEVSKPEVTVTVTPKDPS